MSSGPIEKVHMIILMEPNLEAAIDFYKQLGITLIFHMKDKWAEMKLGTIKIGLCPTAHVMDGHRTGVVLEVADLKEIYEQYKDAITFLSEPKEALHGIMVSFKDPGGNILDLYQPTPHKVTELIKNTVESDKKQTKERCKKGEDCCQVQEGGIA